MYYYYDILLNFQDDNNLFNFYEWEETDAIDFIKKIPLFKISSESFKELLQYRVQFDREFLESIKNKTILKNTKENLKNTFLISDSKDALALELDENGTVINRSRLLLSDEINLSEIMFTMKETKLEYKKLKKYEESTDIRQIEEIKKLINCEINTLYKSKNLNKLKYLYYEWFNKKNNDIDIIYKEMQLNLNSKYDENQKRIYDLIKRSYKKLV